MWIMVTWGILSALTAFVWDQNSFAIVRILLGAAEAGFFPGMISFLTVWIPRDHRARMIGVFNVAVPFSSVIGAPVSSLLLVHLDQVAGLHGWQWLFLLEGMPAVIMGIVVLLALPNGPEQAHWLDAPSKQWLADTLRREREEREADEHFSVWQALVDYRVLLMRLMAVGLVIGTTRTAIWMPQIVRAFGLSVVQTGFVAAIPALALAIAMIVSGRHADRTGERVWHVAGPFLVSAAGFAVAAFTDSPMVSLIGLVIGAAGIGGATPNIWIGLRCRNPPSPSSQFRVGRDPAGSYSPPMCSPRVSRAVSTSRSNDASSAWCSPTSCGAVSTSRSNSASSSRRSSCPRWSSRFSRAVSASRSSGAGSSTATPGGTESPGSISRCLVRRPPRASAALAPPAPVARAANCFSSRATCSSSSAMWAAAVLASRLASRFLARRFALERSSFSMWARSSSLLSFDAEGAIRGARFGEAVETSRLAVLAAFLLGRLAEAAAWPGFRPRTASFAVFVALTRRAIASPPKTAGRKWAWLTFRGAGRLASAPAHVEASSVLPD